MVTSVSSSRDLFQSLIGRSPTQGTTSTQSTTPVRSSTRFADQSLYQKSALGQTSSTSRLVLDRINKINDTLSGLEKGASVLTAARTGLDSIKTLLTSAQTIAQSALGATGGTSPPPAPTPTGPLALSLGEEIRANTTTAGVQDKPSVATLKNNGSVTVWESGGDIYAQRYDSSGATVGAEFRVNTTTAQTQDTASVSRLEDGGFVVVWANKDASANGLGYAGQRYDANGAAVGSEFSVSAWVGGSWNDPKVTGLKDGGFVVSYTAGDASGVGTFVRKYNSSGVDVSGAVQVNTTTFDSQAQSDVVALEDGGFAVAWRSQGQDGGGGTSGGIYTRRFDAGAVAQGAETLVNTFVTGEQNQPSIAALKGGGYVVSWTSAAQDGSNTGVYAQRFDATGAKAGSEFRVNTTTANTQERSSIVGLSDGGFFVAWQSTGQGADAGGAGVGIWGQRYDAQGNKIGEEIELTTTQGTSQVEVSLAAFDNGGFTVAYQSNMQEAGIGVYNPGIYQRRISTVANTVALNSGAETRVNTTTAGDQTNLKLTTLKDGRTLAVWSSGDGSGDGVFGQLYDSSGTKIGGEFQVNTYTYSTQYVQDVIAMDDGGFVIGWASSWQEDAEGKTTLYAQRYDATGTKVGGETRLNSETFGFQSSLSLEAVGTGFVAAWRTQHTGGGWKVYARQFDSAMTPSSAEFQVGTTQTWSEEGEPSIAALNDGGFVVSYSAEDRDGTTGGLWAVVAQRYNSSGAAVGSNFVVNTTIAGNQTDSQVVTLNDGSFVVAWQSDSSQDGSGQGIYGRRYDATGNALGGEFLISTTTNGNQTDVQLVALEDGGFAAAWQSSSGDGSLNGIFAQRFTATGTKVDAEIYVNQTKANEQVTPTITALKDGGFAVGWQSLAQDGSGEGVYMRRFEPAQSIATLTPQAESRVNTTTSGNQTAPAITTLSDGSYIVSWASQGQDGSGWGVYGQRYTAAGQKAGSEFLINTTTSADQNEVSLTALDNGGFLAVFNNNSTVASQKFDSTGTKVGGQQVISTSETWKTSITKLSDGSLVVALSFWGQDNSSSYGVFGQKLDSEGNLVGGTFQVNTAVAGTQNGAQVTALSNGGFAFSWVDDTLGGTFARTYNSSGTATSSAIQVSSNGAGWQFISSITGLKNGGFAVTWTDTTGQDGDLQGVYGRIYDSSGVAVGSDFQINTYTDGEQKDPNITALEDGTFVVSYISSRYDGQSGIYGQRFSATGTKIDTEFKISTTSGAYGAFDGTTGTPPVLTAIKNGGFAVAWNLAGADGSGDGVYIRQYDGTLTSPPASPPPSGGGTSSTDRAAAAAQVASIFNQITTIARNAGVNNINLLQSGILTVSLTGGNSTPYTITGTQADATGLGLTSALTSNQFATDTNINTALSSIQSAISKVDNEKSRFNINSTLLSARDTALSDILKNLSATGPSSPQTTTPNTARDLARFTRNQLFGTTMNITDKSTSLVQSAPTQESQTRTFNRFAASMYLRF